jgi:hypothetical protein
MMRWYDACLPTSAMRKGHIKTRRYINKREGKISEKNDAAVRVLFFLCLER